MPADQLRLHCREIERLLVRWATRPVEGGLEARIEEAFLDTIASVNVGTPYSFLEQYGGRIVHDLRPSLGHEAEVSSRGRVPLGLHTDDAFLDASARAEYVALVGLLNPRNVPTLVVALDDVLDAIGTETVVAMSRPSFQFALPGSFEIDVDRYSPMSRPVLRERPDGQAEVALAPRLCVAPGHGPEVAAHLDRFRSAVDRSRRSEVVLAPGEILVLSNSRCLHGRPAVDADRWIKRVYLRKDFAALDRVGNTGMPRIYAAEGVLRHAARGRSDW